MAQPVVVAFDQAIIDREAALQALSVETSEPVEGAWYWIDSREVHWRPKNFWPSGVKVKVYENLVGMDLGDGNWGVSRRESEFKVGREQFINGNFGIPRTHSCVGAATCVTAAKREQ